VGIPDPHWGEAVAVAVVARGGAEVDAGALTEHVRDRLAAFKKPRYVLFFSELPRTAGSRQVHKPLLREEILRRLAAARA
jgi:acyl-CoA synthetase (AMP-forming)/AMP-acid ligase II